MKFSEIVDAIAKGARAKAEAAGVVKDAVNKISTSSVGKVLGRMAAIKFVDGTIGDIVSPIIGALAVPGAWLEEKLEMIPGLGKAFEVIRKASDWTTKTVGGILIPKASQGYNEVHNHYFNNPKYFENLFKDGMDFTLPANYNNADVAILGSTYGVVNVPSVVTFSFVKPVFMDKQQALLRANNIYDLIVAATKVSSTLYSPEDILGMQGQAEAIVSMYVLLKKVISCAPAYSGLKANMPKAIISQLGFNPAEVRQNLADYISTFNNFVESVNRLGVMHFGHGCARIQDTLIFLKDSQLKCATYINENILVPSGKDDNYDIWNDIVTSQTTSLVKCPLGNSQYVWDHSTVSAAIERLLSHVTDTATKRKLRADMIATFGSAVLLKLDAKFYDIYKTAKFDILQLYAIKNMDTNLFVAPMYAAINSNEEEVHHRMLTKGVWIDYSQTIVDQKPRTTVHKLYSTLDNSGAKVGRLIAIPKSNNTSSKVIALDADHTYTLNNIRTNSQVKTIHKDLVDKGQAYEMISMTYRNASVVTKAVPAQTASVEPTAEFTVYGPFLIPVLAQCDIGLNQLTYPFLELGVQYESYASLENDFGTDPSDVTLWSLVDFMPEIIVYNELTERDITLWDVDNIAEYSYMLWNKANRNITYSMLCLKVKAQTERGKQIQSVVDLYTE